MSTPKVQAYPTFKIGDTLEDPEGNAFVVEKITKSGDYQCKGRAGLLPKSAARNPLTEAQKAELAAETPHN